MGIKIDSYEGALFVREEGDATGRYGEVEANIVNAGTWSLAKIIRLLQS